MDTVLTANPLAPERDGRTPDAIPGPGSSVLQLHEGLSAHPRRVPGVDEVKFCMYFRAAGRTEQLETVRRRVICDFTHFDSVAESRPARWLSVPYGESA